MPKYHYGAVDDHGCTYVIREPGTGSLKSTMNAVHVMKYDDQGNQLLDFAALMPSGTTSVNRVAGIDVDSHDNIYLLGTLVGGTTTNVAADTAFIAKYDDQGNCMGATDITGQIIDVEGIRVDEHDKIHVFASGTTTGSLAYVFDDEHRAFLDFGTSA